jgi:hypothetical protein
MNIAPSAIGHSLARRNGSDIFYQLISLAGFTARIRVALGGDNARMSLRCT